ncbi:MAG: SAM-dependent DNA methyltransferase [Deltaproteobacteria bacterium]|nr:SAM-dependent DNA methyltransferase [Deltaproteobacteria bacterium]
MPPLDKIQRNQLEAAVLKARATAEDGAKSALGYLGVAQASCPPYLNAEQRALRERLRVHGLQLGDSLNGDETQTMGRLVEETAYEHWHRMLFASILERNDLLMFAEGCSPVSVTITECGDLAWEAGEPDRWSMAARLASQMLPQIFRVKSPVFQLVFPHETIQDLEKILEGLPHEIYMGSDTLGWIFQDWQSERKEEINASEVKIGERELPAVTQLFTDEYMVSFLLDNSLGAWWAARRLSDSELSTAENESELRKLASLPGVPMNYLRFVREGDGPWKPAAGRFERWPDRLSDFRLLDPCCGSGHFLVASLHMLVPMRMNADGLSACEAVDAVLRDNIHGLEIDSRCVEIAAFSLAMAAWTYPGAGGFRELPELNIACSGIAVGASKDAWTDLAGGDVALESTLATFYDSFRDAPVIGSLIDPKLAATGEGFYRAKWDDVKLLLDRALTAEASYERKETAVVAHGVVKAAELLSCCYWLVTTNVPYLSRSKQNDTLRVFFSQYYTEAKNDLATVCLERCVSLCEEGGTVSVVLPQNWLFLSSYRRFRIGLLKNHSWNMLAKLGARAFDAISGEIVKAVLLTMSYGKPKDLEFMVRGLDVSDAKTPVDKSSLLAVGELKISVLPGKLDSSDARVTFDKFGDSDDLSLLEKYASSLVGIQTGDDPMFTLSFWELPELDRDIWELLQVTPAEKAEFAGMSRVVRWERGAGFLFSVPFSYPTKGLKAVGKDGIIINRMGDIFPYRYSKERFHQNVAVILPKDPSLVPALWSFCSSPEYRDSIKTIDNTLKVTNATLGKVPFDIDRWTEVAKADYPNGLPAPHSDDPAQWIFHGHPCGSVVWDEKSKRVKHAPLRIDGTVLHVAVARLLGYRWPAELDTEMELADEQREWVRRCGDLAEFRDRNGIVAIPAVNGEAKATDRLLGILIAAYGESWSNSMVSRLLENSDHEGGDLESWLRDKFFAQHCKLFRDRPFIWQVWDGLRDGFSALVNCHKLDRHLIVTLTYSYLGDWIARLRYAIKTGGSEAKGAQERLDAAMSLRKRLEAIRDGEAPYDIFVRWKPLEEQPLGWNPDINDGVRINIRPFMMPPDVKKKGAGILRYKPNIRWDKDRGKDAESAPWYHVDKGDRINDRHLKLAEKEKSRS